MAKKVFYEIKNGKGVDVEVKQKRIHMWSKSSFRCGISRPKSPTADRLASRYDVTKLLDGLPHILQRRPGSKVKYYDKILSSGI